MHLPILSAPVATTQYIDYAQRRYRWVGPRGRNWYQAALLGIVQRHSLHLLY